MSVIVAGYVFSGCLCGWDNAELRVRDCQEANTVIQQAIAHGVVSAVRG